MKAKLTPVKEERYEVIRLSLAGDITNAEAAARLRLKVRQVKNLKRKVKRQGEVGIIHGNRGKPSNRATDTETTNAVVAFVREDKHRDFGPTFAQEQLLKQKTSA